MKRTTGGRRWLWPVSILFLALFPGTGWAQGAEPAPMIDWRCWVGRDALYSIHCLNFGVPIFVEAGMPVRNDARVPDRFRRDLFAAGASPNLARLVRADPEAYDGRVWLIPLYTAPIDMEHVRLLARSVMCGRDPRCVVHLSNTPPGMGMLLH